MYNFSDSKDFPFCNWGMGGRWPACAQYVCLLYTMCITCVTIYIYTCVHKHFTIYIHLHCISTNIDCIGAKLDAFQAPLAERSQSVTMNITHGKRCVIPPKVFLLPKVFIPPKVFLQPKVFIFYNTWFYQNHPKVFIFYNTWFHQNHPASTMTIHLIIQCWKYWHHLLKRWHLTLWGWVLIPIRYTLFVD